MRIQVESNERSQRWAGCIIKCPNCGEHLNAFTANCPACGHELRGVTASESVQELASMLSPAQTNAQRIHLLRSFPIPNTKEDIIEFMILACSNFSADSYLYGGEQKEISEAWLAKIEQGYQKATMLFSGDAAFAQVQQLYEQTAQDIDEAIRKRNTKSIVSIMLRNAGALSGLVLLISAMFFSIFDNDLYSLLMFFGCVILVISALSLGRKGCLSIDLGVGAGSGLAAILLSFLIKNGEMCIFFGCVVLIIVAVMLIVKRK